MNGTSPSTRQETDVFGNTIQYNATTGVYTDTLGIADYTVTVPIAVSYPDTGGTIRELSFSSSGTDTLSRNFTINSPGCPQVEQESGSTWIATASMSFPDGTSITFTPEVGYAGTGTTTGRIGSFTTRQGGEVSYSYGNPWCGTGMLNNGGYLARTDAYGTTTFTSDNGVGGQVSTTTVLDPGKNKTVYHFELINDGNPNDSPDPIIAQITYYQNTGTISSPAYTLFKTVVICYNGQSSGCAGSTDGSETPLYSYSVNERDTYTTLGSMSTSSRVQELFDSYGNTTSVANYDFGASSPTLTTSTTYGTWNGSTCVSIGNYINNKPCDVKTVDNASRTIGETRRSYSSKGSLLTTHDWTGSAWLSNLTANSYNANGTIASSYDLANNQTAYTYNSASYSGCPSGGCTNYPFPTSVSKGGVTTYSTWNGYGAVKLTDQDANGATTTYGYSACVGGAIDPFWRVMSVIDPLGNETCKTYPSGSSPDISSSSFAFNGGASIQSTTTTTDGYGRPVNRQTAQAPGSGNYDTVSTVYSWLGTSFSVATSQRCTEPLGSGCTAVHTRQYDVLRRMQSATTTGNETLTHTYTQNDDLAVLSPAPSGENNKQVQKQYDGLGRLAQSCAIGNGSTTACNQSTGSANGVTTSNSYTYASGSSTTTATRGSQSRSKTVDAMGRTIQTAMPESGTWSYTYDTPCSSSYYNTTSRLAETVDANGNTLCYSYDALGRVTLVNADGTTCRWFYYDNGEGNGTTSGGYTGTVPTGITLTNQYGRMVEAATDGCTAVASHTSSTLITDEWFAYDKDGNKTNLWQLTPHSTQYYHSTATFFGNGVPATVDLANPSLYTMTYGLDGEGRISTLTDTTASQSIVTGTTYFPAANPAVVSLTGTDNDAYTYNTNTGRMTEFVFTVGGNNLTGTLNWNPNGTLGYLSVIDGFNSGGSETCYSNSSGSLGHGYDDLGRLVEFDCGSGNWGQQFAYDQYDNLTKTVLSGRSGTTWNPGYSSTTNRCTGCTYDSNGDVTGDGNYVYGWNEFSKVKWTTTSGTPSCGTSGRCATYDAFGRILETSNGSTWREYWYTQADGKMVMSGTTLSYGRWPMPYGMAETVGTSDFDYLHEDWIGNSRIVSNIGNNTVVADQAYTPYGEIYNIFGANNSQYQVFADTIADLAPSTTTPIMWDTPNRELSYAGRWLSPDPAGVGWNLYAYTTDPNSQTDPTGLGPGDDSGGKCPGGAGPSQGCSSSDSAQNQSSTMQYVKGGGKIVLGLGLIATAAGGDVPGGVAGAVILSSAVLGGTVTTVSGVADVAGAATKTDVHEAQEALDATSNAAGLVVTAATGGNMKAGQTAATVGDMASLAMSPKEATKNVATAVDAGRTVFSAGSLLKSAWNSFSSAVSGAFAPSPGPPIIQTVPGPPQ